MIRIFQLRCQDVAANEQKRVSSASARAKEAGSPRVRFYSAPCCGFREDAQARLFAPANALQPALPLILVEEGAAANREGAQSAFRGARLPNLFLLLNSSSHLRCRVLSHPQTFRLGLLIAPSHTRYIGHRAYFHPSIQSLTGSLCLRQPPPCSPHQLLEILTTDNRHNEDFRYCRRPRGHCCCQSRRNREACDHTRYC